MTTSDRLRQTRRMLGLSQSAMAEKLKISLRQYLRWERGEVDPLERARQIVEGCGGRLTIEWPRVVLPGAAPSPALDE